MSRILIVLVAIFLMVAEANAKDVRVTVNGMVCSLCAHGLNKKFLEHESVEKVDIRFDEKLVVLSLKEGAKIEDDEVQQIVEWAGYEAVSIVREDKE